MKKDIVSHLIELLDLPESETAEYLTSFMETWADCNKQLEQQQTQMDFSQFRVITHTIIGFSENMGASDLLELARALNLAAKAADVAECKKQSQAIFELYQKYVDEK